MGVVINLGVGEWQKKAETGLTLFETGWGKFAPKATKLSAISVPNALGSPKFMTLFHSMSDPS